MFSVLCTLLPAWAHPRKSVSVLNNPLCTLQTDALPSQQSVSILNHSSALFKQQSVPTVHTEQSPDFLHHIWKCFLTSESICVMTQCAYPQRSRDLNISEFHLAWHPPGKCKKWNIKLRVRGFMRKKFQNGSSVEQCSPSSWSSRAQSWPWCHHCLQYEVLISLKLNPIFNVDVITVYNMRCWYDWN